MPNRMSMLPCTCGAFGLASRSVSLLPLSHLSSLSSPPVPSCGQATLHVVSFVERSSLAAAGGHGFQWRADEVFDERRAHDFRWTVGEVSRGRRDVVSSGGVRSGDGREWKTARIGEDAQSGGMTHNQEKKEGER